MKKDGFTLIELLVVVTVLAILALAGMAAFRNAAGNARDAKRKADIDAIAKAYETKFDAGSSLYPVLVGTDFTSVEIPTPPEGGNYSGFVTAASSAFQICATLENGSQYCKSSSQGE